MAIIFATQTSAGDPITFKFVRGARWDDDVQLTDQTSGAPIDLTDVEEILMRVRASAGASTTLLELSTTNGRLVVTNAATGSVGVRVDSATTHDSFPANGHKKAKYVYDALIERTPGEYEPAIAGKVTVLPQITRPLDDA